MGLVHSAKGTSVQIRIKYIQKNWRSYSDFSYAEKASNLKVFIMEIFSTIPAIAEIIIYLRKTSIIVHRTAVILILSDT